MERLLQSIHIGVNDKLYIKDPQSTTLGKRIVEESILLIHEIGFDAFTFRKLGQRISSNESSIYRYFENKHKMLLYLTSWYWSWLEYKLVFSTNSMKDAREKLKTALAIVTQPTEVDSNISHINEVLLTHIVINEYSKSYLTKEVDTNNKEGYFVIYKRLVDRLSTMIKEVDASYPYPSSLASTVLEGSLHQYFLKDHFPSLTDCHEKGDPTQYFTELVFNSLNKKPNG